MRLCGMHGEKRFVDFGGTHNFLSEPTTQRLGYAIKEVLKVHMIVANGQELQCKRLCENLEVRVQG